MQENKQHVQLPNNMGSADLTPKDQLIYLSIRRFMNGKSKIAFPSLEKIHQVSGASINTIRKSITSLEEKNYLKVIKNGKKQEYHFNELKAFEPFSYEFLDRTDLTFTEKSYLVASQQYMYTDVEGLGKISYTNKELSTKINMSEATISRTNNSLIRKNYLSIIKNECRDLETGCKTDTKIFHLRDLDQAIIWTLKSHEDRIEQNTEDIKTLQSKIEKQQLLIDKLLKQIQPDNNDFIL